MSTLGLGDFRVGHRRRVWRRLGCNRQSDAGIPSVANGDRANRVTMSQECTIQLNQAVREVEAVENV